MATAPRNQRACMLCSIVHPYSFFIKNGCPNCEEFLQLQNSPDAINELTSQVFEGTIALYDPKNSWVAKWQRLAEYVPGTYAVKVVGKLPEDIVGALEDAGRAIDFLVTKGHQLSSKVMDRIISDLHEELLKEQPPALFELSPLLSRPDLHFPRLRGGGSDWVSECFKKDNDDDEMSQANEADERGSSPSSDFPPHAENSNTSKVEPTKHKEFEDAMSKSSSSKDNQPTQELEQNFPAASSSSSSNEQQKQDVQPDLMKKLVKQKAKNKGILPTTTNVANTVTESTNGAAHDSNQSQREEEPSSSPQAAPRDPWQLPDGFSETTISVDWETEQMFPGYRPRRND